MSLKENDSYYENINEYAEEFQLELASNLSVKRLPHQITSVWLKMVKDYPHLYSMDDYMEACRKMGYLLF